ncbi:AAA family ATPase [candidate division WOR-3 bacterium]|uniref:AAA family ATPase n=1 Tax=candidate division WOR-3 bacterium TaxID=2052148 RepID=A0A9D5KA71_UNCW3|nr:AAA family ATPase [candidate division WOR-3 bacterium]MBD3365236.1 AAA family ATPase [candidate division WOR-3 bacterium]
MLKRIKIKGYKSFKDAEIELTPLSVLMGPNAAGKSNFLDALQLLSRIATSPTLKDAFEPPYRGKPMESFTFGSQGLKGLLSNTSVSFSLEVDVELSNLLMDSLNNQIIEMRRKPTGELPDVKQLSLVRERFLRYSVKIEIRPQAGGLLRVIDERLEALKTNGEPKTSRNPFLERTKENRLSLRMEKQAHPTYFEVGLDHTVLSTAPYLPYYPHVNAMRQEFASWQFFYLEPRERMRAANPVKEVRHIGLMGEDLAAFLNTLQAVDEKQFEAIKKAIAMIIPTINGIQVEVNELGEAELRLVERNTPISARLLSEGTLRVLGLLALRGAKEIPALVGFEEPENGVHPRRIQLIAEYLKTFTSGTQLIATTHSPLLIENIPDDSLYVCTRRNGYSSIEPFSTWGPLGRKKDVEKALCGEEILSKSERILRGDFDS